VLSALPGRWRLLRRRSTSSGRRQGSTWSARSMMLHH
jgi:hypothetical protein